MRETVEDVMRGKEADQVGIASLMGRIADGLGKLVSEHIALARLELVEDAKVMGGQAAKLAAFIPFLLVGYGLVCVALAFFLSRWMGHAGAFAVVGGVNLVGGLFGVLRAAQVLKRHRVMDDTLAELDRSTQLLAAAKEPAPILPMERGQ